ncbi:MAG: hypothetical protein ACOZEN_12610 [Thermodesulfobacteriota bacterium]
MKTLVTLMTPALLIGLPSSTLAQFDCLPDPRSLFCPTCPALLKCFTLQEWVSFLLFGVY